MKKYIKYIVIAVLVLSISAVGYKLYRSRTFPPLQLTTVQGSNIKDIMFFKQYDNLWSKDKLGSSNLSMGGYGCLVTSIASSLTAQGLAYNPKELNELFNEKNVYDSQGNIIWRDLEKAVPNSKVILSQKIEDEELRTLVANNEFPIVEVKYKGDGYWHWVVLIGWKDGEYLCMDPLSKTETPTPLSAHGNIIYSWRVVKLENS